VNSIGLSRKVAQEELESLVAQKNVVIQLMIDKGYMDNPFLSDQSSKAGLEFKLNDLRRQIAEVREYHSLHLLGSLDSESKRLNSLTGGLIGLTIALIAATIALVVRAFM